MDTATQKAHFFRRASFGATQQELGSSAKPKELLEHWLGDKQPMATLLGAQREEPKPFEMDKKSKGCNCDGSGGTDHGTAGPIWLMGPVRAGFYGGEPALDSLQQENLPMQVDFRRVYAEILDRWFGTPAKGILAGSFSGVGFL